METITTEKRPPPLAGDPSYFDLRTFPTPKPGETWVQARMAQVAAIQGRANCTIAISDNSPSKGGSGFEQARRAIADLKDHGASLRDVFTDLLPAKPYCADTVTEGLIIRSKASALTRRLLQINGPGTLHWIPIDIDLPGAAIAHRDANLPPPNIIATNPENGHAHLSYLLEVPVARHDAARQAPLKYLAAVDRGLRRRLEADPTYSGLIVKNPLHPAWRSEWLRDAPYSLGEINDWLFPRDTAPYASLSDMAGFSRNVTIFDKVRPIAYSEVRNAKRAGKTLEDFQALLQRRAAEMNWAFTTPLPLSEIRAIAKSVAKWTWRHFSDEAFRNLQSHRGKLGNAARWDGHVSAESTKPWEKLGISRRTYYYRRAKGDAT